MTGIRASGVGGLDHRLGKQNQCSHIRARPMTYNFSFLSFAGIRCFRIIYQG